jgi:hypothetical protein
VVRDVEHAHELDVAARNAEVNARVVGEAAVFRLGCEREIFFEEFERFFVIFLLIVNLVVCQKME